MPFNLQFHIFQTTFVACISSQLEIEERTWSLFEEAKIALDLKIKAHITPFLLD